MNSHLRTIREQAESNADKLFIQPPPPPRGGRFFGGDRGGTQEIYSGGVQQIHLRTEDRENGDLGAVLEFWKQL